MGAVCSPGHCVITGALCDHRGNRSLKSLGCGPTTNYFIGKQQNKHTRVLLQVKAHTGKTKGKWYKNLFKLGTRPLDIHSKSEQISDGEVMYCHECTCMMDDGGKRKSTFQPSHHY